MSFIPNEILSVAKKATKEMNKWGDVGAGILESDANLTEKNDLSGIGLAIFAKFHYAELDELIAEWESQHEIPDDPHDIVATDWAHSFACSVIHDFTSKLISSLESKGTEKSIKISELIEMIDEMQ